MAEQPEAEFNLRDLNDQELTEQVHDDLYNGLKAEVEEATRIFLERGWSAAMAKSCRSSKCSGVTSGSPLHRRSK